MAGGGGKILRAALQFLRKIRARGGRGGGGARPPARSGPPRPRGPFTPRPSWRDRHGNLTDGTYRVSSGGNQRHTSGSAPAGRSAFHPGTDVDQLTMDAAQYADQANLWSPRGDKAKVRFDIDVGTHASTDRPTSVVNVYRRRNGTIHSTPGSDPEWTP